MCVCNNNNNNNKKFYLFLMEREVQEQLGTTQV